MLLFESNAASCRAAAICVATRGVIFVRRVFQGIEAARTNHAGIGRPPGFHAVAVAPEVAELAGNDPGAHPLALEVAQGIDHLAGTVRVVVMDVAPLLEPGRALGAALGEGGIGRHLHVLSCVPCTNCR